MVHFCLHTLEATGLLPNNVGSTPCFVQRSLLALKLCFQDLDLRAPLLNQCVLLLYRLLQPVLVSQQRCCIIQASCLASVGILCW